VIISVVVGRLISHTGRYRIFPIIGAAVMAIALFLLSTMNETTPRWETVVYMVLMGIGLGNLMQVLVLIIQNAVDRRMLGVATGAATFLRSMGGSIGVAIGGAVLSNRLTHNLTGIHGANAADLKALAGKPKQILALPDSIRGHVVHAFSSSIANVFMVGVPFALIGLVLVICLREVPLRDSTPAAAPAVPGDDEAGVLNA